MQKATTLALMKYQRSVIKKMKQNYKNIAKVKAIERENTKRLRKLNPEIDNKSGIYFFIRKSEQNENEIYVGQSVDILTRCCQHLVGYNQYIDLSIKAHKLYDVEKNPHGYKLEFLYFPVEELDEKEQYYIKLYQDKGWILKNKTSGSQGKGKEKIAEYKPARGYRDGIECGKRSLARELSHIINTHLMVKLKPEKERNKVSIKALEKFWELLRRDGGNEES